MCAALAGPAGSAFLFLPALCPFCLNFHQREARCFSAGKDGYFVSEGFSRQLPLATAAHNRPTRLQRGGEPASLVSFPTPPSKPHTGPHRGKFVFTSVFPQPFPAGSNRQLLQHENVVGQKKKFSPMAFSLVSLSHIFSVGFPPRFSKAAPHNC